MPKILILGGDADGNLGDAAILSALCHRLAQHHPACEITLVSRRRRPHEWPGLTRVIVPGARGLPALLAAAARQDLVIFGGGGLLQDDDSRAKVPYWAAQLTILKQFQRNVTGLCLGAGPLRHAESRALAGWICGLLREVTVRDGFAHRALQPCTDKPVRVVPDPAFMLEPYAENMAHDLIRSLGLSPERPLLGAVVRGWFHRRGGFVPRKLRARFLKDALYGADARERLTETLAAEVQTLARRLDASVLLMPSYPAAHEGDLAACQALAGRLRDVRSAVFSTEDPALYQAVAGQLRLMVSARMHPLILAATMGVPVVGLGYNGKFDGLFELLELPGQLLSLDALPQAPPGWLEAPTQRALENCSDLRHRCGLLAARVGHHMANLL